MGKRKNMSLYQLNVKRLYDRLQIVASMMLEEIKCIRSSNISLRLPITSEDIVVEM